MSRQSKQAKKLALAKTFTKLHKDGNKGPAKTTPKHGKVNVAWKRDEVKAARQKIAASSSDETVLEKLKKKKKRE